MKHRLPLALASFVLLAIAALLLAWPRAQHVPSGSKQAWAPTAGNIARGAYLAKAGDCAACHTARGGQAYAGGRAVDTPFGRVMAPNITPDRETGIGAWTADDFWNALHNGIGRDGRLLYPAFPYPNTTKVSRDDADALFAYLRSLPPARQPNQPHALRFPYDSQAALAAWRLLYFKPGVFQAEPARGADWNRGAYLVEGLGHCAACHSPRNQLGASGQGLQGGLIPVLGWYAPSLASKDPHLAQLLQTGVSPNGAVYGPMAEVVGRSLQHLSEGDIGAMTAYLGSLPAERGAPRPAPLPSESLMKLGERIYDRHCVDCHGKDGRGALGADGAPAYPPLAGNRTLATREPVNAIRIVLNGGFAPSTKGNPRPYGMPPFSQVLDDAEVAAVVSYVRASWGNAARMVTAPEVNGYRAVPLD
ncbi:c-type cytochrome [Massilia aerilata]|uniref:C-type cytochrome n=1 Tax=Massilia aerilata TaxID=453817 RepID=A0ABW0S3U6_9BURK